MLLRLGIDRTIGIGAALLAAGGLGAAAAVLLGGASPVPLIAAMAFYAVGMGLVQPQTMAGAMMPFPQRASTASSLLGVSQMVCAAAIGVIVGHLIGTSAWPILRPSLSGANSMSLCLWEAPQPRPPGRRHLSFQSSSYW